MRGILAIGLAGLLAFTAPAYSADLGMPVKAPPPVEAPPPEFDWAPLLLGLLVIGGIAACIALCEGHHETPPPPVSAGANASG